ncbi:MAG TPA: hypothetical protein ENN07_04605 [candidate division Zixibacteria bacterium]|nr:hypothetical protein [candidate division Zixibacteria bacterium]
MKHFFEDSREWAEGRLPVFRGLLLLFFLIIGIRHLADPMFNSIFKGLNLGIHELGHFLFLPFGHFMHMVGGTITQLAVPVISMLMFYRQKDYFAIAVSFGWLSTNFYDIAVYVADARALALPLVSPFGTEVIHDWNYLLGKLNMLSWDKGLGRFSRFLGLVSMLLCLVYGGWLVYWMFRTYRIEKLSDFET